MNKEQIFRFAIVMILMVGNQVASGQGISINTSGSPADASAALDVASTTQGILVPRMKAAQIGLISSPATGLLVFQTDGTPGFWFYNGTAWVSLNAPGGTSSLPLTTAGDMVIENAIPAPDRLAVGTGTQYLGVSSGLPAWTTPVSTPTASTLAGWDASMNLSANNFIAGQTTTATSATTLGLANTSAEQQILTGNTAQTVTLPTTGVTAGQQFNIYNTSSATTTVNASGGTGTVLMNPGTAAIATAMAAAPTTPAGWSVMNSGGGLFNMQVFTASGTYTPSTGTTGIMVEVVGGGASGSSCSGSSTGPYAGNGGSGGGYVKGWISGLSSITTYSVAVGAAQTTSGTAGNRSSFTTTNPAFSFIAGGGSGTGGTASGGKVNIPGQRGSSAIAVSSAEFGIPGTGGNSVFGGGGTGIVNEEFISSGGAGNPGATNSGGGGGGGSIFVIGTTLETSPGGNGAAGIVIIYEYH